MAQLEKDGIEIVARMRRGAVVETIVRTAVEGDFDLIVIGTEGRGKTSLRGATAERVAHLSPIPVLTAPLASQQQHEERTRVA